MLWFEKKEEEKKNTLCNKTTGNRIISMWSPVIPSDETETPCCRSKHAICQTGPHIYLLGGRRGNSAIKDFWCYHKADRRWEKVVGTGPSPGFLQDHTMVAYKDFLYVFGGELSFCNHDEIPLWKLNIVTKEWRKLNKAASGQSPKGLRGHTATVHQENMYIYGGYQELKGSSGDVWVFHFETETWSKLCQVAPLDGLLPPGRHHHSAVLHDSNIWVYGGLTGLTESSHFNRIDLVTRQWRAIRNRGGPGCLHSHVAVKFRNAMLLVGGSRDGTVVQQIWRFHFATESWDMVTSDNLAPLTRLQSRGLVVEEEIEGLINTYFEHADNEFPTARYSHSTQSPLDGSSVNSDPVCTFNSLSAEVSIHFPSRNTSVKEAEELRELIPKSKQNNDAPVTENGLYPKLEEEEQNIVCSSSDYDSLEDLAEESVGSDKQLLIGSPRSDNVQEQVQRIARMSSRDRVKITIMILGGKTEEQTGWNREPLFMWKAEFPDFI